jgi:hypothetical protein
MGKNDIAEDRSAEVKYVTYGVTAKKRSKPGILKCIWKMWGSDHHGIMG